VDDTRAQFCDRCANKSGVVAGGMQGFDPRHEMAKPFVKL